MRCFLLIVLSLFVTLPSWADTIELKSGTGENVLGNIPYDHMNQIRNKFNSNLHSIPEEEREKVRLRFEKTLLKMQSGPSGITYDASPGSESKIINIEEFE